MKGKSGSVGGGVAKARVRLKMEEGGVERCAKEVAKDAGCCVKAGVRKGCGKRRKGSKGGGKSRTSPFRLFCKLLFPLTVDPERRVAYRERVEAYVVPGSYVTIADLHAALCAYLADTTGVPWGGLWTSAHLRALVSDFAFSERIRTTPPQKNTPEWRSDVRRAGARALLESEGVVDASALVRELFDRYHRMNLQRCRSEARKYARNSSRPPPPPADFESLDPRPWDRARLAAFVITLPVAADVVTAPAPPPPAHAAPSPSAVLAASSSSPSADPPAFTPSPPPSSPCTLAHPVRPLAPFTPDLLHPDHLHPALAFPHAPFSPTTSPLPPLAVDPRFACGTGSVPLAADLFAHVF